MSTRLYFNSETINFSPTPKTERKLVVLTAEVQGTLGNVADKLGKIHIFNTETPLLANTNLYFTNRYVYGNRNTNWQTQIWSPEFSYTLPSPNPNFSIFKRLGAFAINLPETGQILVEDVELNRDYHWHNLPFHKRLAAGVRGIPIPTQEMQNRMSLLITPADDSNAAFATIQKHEQDALALQVVEQMVNETAEIYAAYMQSEYFTM